MSHKIVIVGLLLLMASVVGFILYPERPPAVDEAWEAQLQAKSAEMNKDLPALVDEETILNATTAKGNILEFRHTWPSLQAEDVDVDTTSSQLYEAIRPVVCSSAEMKVYRDHKTTLHYVYYDKDGDYVLGIKIETRDCKTSR